MFNGELSSPIHLLPHQIDHVDKIWKSLTQKGELSYMDTSRTGLGKTHIALEIAFRLQKLFGMKVAIIASGKTAIQNDDGWKFWAEQYGITIEKATTYSAIRGKGTSISDDWIYKNNDDKKIGYHATEKFKSIAKEGIFIIFDEFHMATRESSTHYACAALVRMCARYPTRCRIGLLSLTPGDKKEHNPPIMRLIGLVSSPVLLKYNRSDKSYEWTKYGLGEMIRSCVARGADVNQINADLAWLSATRAKQLLGVLYDRYIKAKVCFAMPIPISKHKINMRNCFLECYKGDIKNLDAAIARLCDGVNWDGYDVSQRNEWNLGQINIALRLIERYKLRTIAKYINKRLQENPNKKFIVSIGSRNTEHFDMMTEIMASMRITVPLGVRLMLEKARKDPTNVWSILDKDTYKLILEHIYKPNIDIMSGETAIADRVKIHRRFQAKNSDSWCLLISPGVGDKALSFHDVHGNHPRELIVVPDHYHTRLTQITGRVDRIGVASDVDVSIIYCKETRLETSIIQAMSYKSDVAKSMLAEKQEHLFPGKFDVWVENE